MFVKQVKVYPIIGLNEALDALGKKPAETYLAVPYKKAIEESLEIEPDFDIKPFRTKKVVYGQKDIEV